MPPLDRAPSFAPASRPGLWAGYYGRTVGFEHAFHVRARNVGRFWPEADYDAGHSRLEIPFSQAPGCQRDIAPRDLAVAVNDAKKRDDFGLRGGAFLINEFGQVLVPSHGGLQVFHVGIWSGPIWLANFTGSGGAPTSLYEDQHLSSGDEWKRPYVGSSYLASSVEGQPTLASRDGTEVVARNGYFGEVVFPMLRKMRSDSRMHFLITLGGLVLTRVTAETGFALDKKVFVGSIDLAEWRHVIEAL
jgi:hypothetical protein